MEQKLIAIVGLTASGKSELAVKLAKKFNGEIISADSRQVYKGLDVGTAKITRKDMRGIPHHLLSVVSPKKRYSVVEYQKAAQRAILGILKRNHTPILVGGSPQYLYSVVDNWIMPKVAPDRKFRAQLEKLSVEKLFLKLKKLDLIRAKSIEQKNKRRLIRALEIIHSTGKPVPALRKNALPYPVLLLGIARSKEDIKKRIKKRFLLMLKGGFLQEIKRLRKEGISFKRVESFGLEYKEGAEYLQGKISKEEMIAKAVKATEDFSRRQLVWFKKDQRICWIKNQREAAKLISSFL